MTPAARFSLALADRFANDAHDDAHDDSAERCMDNLAAAAASLLPWNRPVHGATTAVGGVSSGRVRSGGVGNKKKKKATSGYVSRPAALAAKPTSSKYRGVTRHRCAPQHMDSASYRHIPLCVAQAVFIHGSTLSVAFCWQRQLLSA